MGKVEKKKKKLEERITMLQEELNHSLTKKSSSTGEINVGEFQRRILELRKQLNEM